MRAWSSPEDPATLHLGGFFNGARVKELVIKFDTPFIISPFFGRRRPGRGRWPHRRGPWWYLRRMPWIGFLPGHVGRWGRMESYGVNNNVLLFLCEPLFFQAPKKKTFWGDTH